MDLIRRLAPRFAALVVSLVLVGCGSDDPIEYGDDALLLPATLGEALPLATSEARAREEGAYLTRLGGGFTVLDEGGQGANHTFVFHTRATRGVLRRITVHLFHGSPWVDVVTVPEAPPPFDAAELSLDSDAVVERAIQLAPIYAVALAPAYSARLSTVPSWPEPESVTDVGTDVAWRVDFLVLQPIGNTTVYFSSARFYFDPESGDLLGPPEHPASPELYPFP
jgi:hypothetical protein